MTKKELVDELLRQTRSCHAIHERMTSFVLCILSEGDHDAVMLSDGNILYFSEIADLLDSNNFPAMRGKPKFLFLDISSQKLERDAGQAIPQCCENVKLTTRPQHQIVIQQQCDSGVSNDTRPSTIDQQILHDPKKVALKSDFVFCLASFPFYVGLHNKEVGSIATRVLTEVFYKHAHNRHAVDLIYKMRRKLSSKRLPRNQQVITTRETLTKDFYFFPSLRM